MQTLDVRPMPPRVRHETIFQSLDALPTGGTLRLVNDHDPLPLRYQLDAEHPHEFTWDYVESGPEEWSVDITNRAHVFDARPALARGEEPFAQIMEVAAAVSEGEVLVLFAPFEPVPLEGVLGAQGFESSVTDLGDGDWRVTFQRV